MATGAHGRWACLGADRGSAPAEFVMVSALLTLLTLSVMQLALVLHVRNTVQDAAAEGARYAALADNSFAEGVERTESLITAAVGPAYARNVTVASTTYLGHPAAVVTVSAPLPLIGLIGPDTVLEVRGHAALETLD
ncbi:TadE/TadG family type IV pilus assembly protein [Salinibacterium hongtaonis]|nr:TadE/TadG family type IV pilus assembly protein [Salinibacterium hongtaonis]